MRSNAAPIQRERLHDQAVRQIAYLILRSTTDGEQAVLPNEFELSNQLNVSRTVVREAIKVLASKGMVDVRPKTGMRVRPREDWNLLDPDLLAWQYEVSPDTVSFGELAEVRLIVEAAVAERAGQRATDADIADLEHWYGEMERAIDDPTAFVAADLHFHNAIFSACHNDLLKQMSTMIIVALRSSGMLTTRVPGTIQAALPFHRAVADAIARHDGPGARAAMERLLMQAARDIDNVLRTSGEPETEVQTVQAAPLEVT